jgi:hypothetical protein
LNGDNCSAAAPSESSQIEETTKFSFGFNENSDALSTTSDDEFGFLGGGGGGSSVGGDDFFMMGNGGYNHEHEGFDEVSGDYSTATTEVSVEPQKRGNLSNSAFCPHQCAYHCVK